MKALLFGVLASLALLAGCQAAAGESPAPAESAPAGSAAAESAPAAEYHKITPEEAKEKMDAGDVVVVDVRTQAEYDEGHIENAVLVPNESIGDTMPAALPDLDATLLVYCRSGRRSKEASEKLVALGYRNVYDFGGILDWPYGVTEG